MHQAGFGLEADVQGEQLGLLWFGGWRKLGLFYFINKNVKWFAVVLEK